MEQWDVHLSGWGCPPELRTHAEIIIPLEEQGTMAAYPPPEAASIMP